MHASACRMQMSEETFQIFLDLMEKHFAALRIPDVDSEQKLTRAVSFSELPTSRRIIVEQSYQSGNSAGLVRQYSCEQIFDTTSNTRQVNISEVVRRGENKQIRTWRTIIPYCDDSKRTSRNALLSNAPGIDAPIEDRTIHTNVDDNISTYRTKIAPCFVPKNSSLPSQKEDASSSRTDAKDQQINSTVTDSVPAKKLEYEHFKNKLRRLAPRSTPKKPMGYCSFRTLLFFVSFLIVIFAIFLWDEGNREVCEHKSHFDNATTELREKVHGQNDAIMILIDSLVSSTPCLKTIALVGSTGVGKTHTAEIILRNFPSKDRAFQYFPPIPNKLKNGTFSHFFCNLVVLENLREWDIIGASHFVTMIKGMKVSCMTILAIFNLQKITNNLDRIIELEESTTMIKNAFWKDNNDVEVITYQPLDAIAIEKCINDAAIKSQLELTSDQINDVKDVLLLSQSGCKGVFSKVQVIGRGDA